MTPFELPAHHSFLVRTPKLKHRRRLNQFHSVQQTMLQTLRLIKRHQDSILSRPPLVSKVLSRRIR